MSNSLSLSLWVWCQRGCKGGVWPFCCAHCPAAQKSASASQGRDVPSGPVGLWCAAHKAFSSTALVGSFLGEAVDDCAVTQIRRCVIAPEPQDRWHPGWAALGQQKEEAGTAGVGIRRAFICTSGISLTCAGLGAGWCSFCKVPVTSVSGRETSFPRRQGTGFFIQASAGVGA